MIGLGLSIPQRALRRVGESSDWWEPEYPGATLALRFTTLADTGETVTPNVAKSGQSVMWDYGDGTTQTANSGSHTYASDGPHDMTLVIYDDPTTITQLQVPGDKIDGEFPSELSALTSLTNLGCGGNNISVLDVSRLTALAALYCGSNSISVLDVSALASLAKLSCDKNNISVLDVSSLTAMTYLNCGSNSISVLDVSALTSLDKLYCYSNSIIQSNVDQIVNDVWAARDSYTAAAPYFHIGGTNANPSGVYQDVCSPTTPLEKIYNLANAQCAGDTFNAQTWVY